MVKFFGACGQKPLERRRLMVALSLAVIFLASESVQAEPEWASAFCRDRACVFVETDPDLTEEAKEIVQTLRLRMCGRGLEVFFGAAGSAPPQIEEGRGCLRPGGALSRPQWWTVYLRSAVEDRLLVVIDHLGRRSDEDVVRDLPRGPDARSTAWTVVLAVEEAVLAYLESGVESAALGSGLALVEPEVVGGFVPAPPPMPEERLSIFEALRVGVSLYYLHAVRSALLGPRISVGIRLSPHISLSLGAGWAGLGQFERRQIDGSVSHAPLDLLVSFRVLTERFFHLALDLGTSAGVAVYHTSNGVHRRTDTMFSPWVLAGIRLGFDLFGPLRLELVPGVTVPIFHDVLLSEGAVIYRQDWALASLALDLAVLF
jgi:hypothetical protein